jgi:GH18 family chitinase
MASNSANRKKFITSVIRYLKKYDLDGIDIDWEYPVADDRGGVAEDKANYVLLLKEMREQFDGDRAGWQITVTLPTSYW